MPARGPRLNTATVTSDLRHVRQAEDTVYAFACAAHDAYEYNSQHGADARREVRHQRQAQKADVKMMFVVTSFVHEVRDDVEQVDWQPTDGVEDDHQRQYTLNADVTAHVVLSFVQ